jgi:hypothetical protein
LYFVVCIFMLTETDRDQGDYELMGVAVCGCQRHNMFTCHKSILYTYIIIRNTYYLLISDVKIKIIGLYF